MSCVESKLEDALVTYLKAELSRSDIYPAMGDQAYALPSIIVACSNASTREGGTIVGGIHLRLPNYTIEGFIEIQTHSADTTRAEHYTLFKQIKNAIACQEILADLNAVSIDDFHIFLFELTNTQHSIIDDDKRVSRHYFNAIACDKNI